MQARLIIVDRDARYREWLRNHLGVLFPDGTIAAADMKEFESGWERLTRGSCDLVVLVAQFGTSPEDPRSEGLEWLRELRDHREFPPVIAIAEDGNELTAVRSIQLGAADYLPKRLVTPERLSTAVKLALRRLELAAASSPPAAAPAPTPLPTSEDEDDEDSPERTLRAPIPGYSIRKTIGESEKAVVYLATSIALQSDVAVKISKAEEAPEQRRELAREHTVLSALSTIKHPSIVDIYDYGVHDGREYLAMEYFPRGDLKGRLARGILEVDALRYLEQIGRALQVVHQAGILHRDLKPPNLMMRDNDTIVLIDFGLALRFDSSRSTRTGVLRGSPYYMSPEQALGEELDGRTDLYSMGIIFYEMITGRKPYSGNSPMDVLQQHVAAPVPQLPPPLSHLQALLDGLVAKSREERFGSAAEAVEAIVGMRALRRVRK